MQTKPVTLGWFFFRTLLLASFVCLSAGANLAWGDAPDVCLVNGTETPARLQIEIMPLFEPMPGYMPVRVKFLSYVDNPIRFAMPLTIPGPAPRDRTIEFSITAASAYYGASGTAEAWHKITIPKGALSAEMVMTVPIYALIDQGMRANWYYVSLKENGRLSRGNPYIAQGTNNNMATNAGNIQRATYSTGILFVNSAVPNADQRQTILAGAQPGKVFVDPKTHDLPEIDLLLYNWDPVHVVPRSSTNPPSDWEQIRSLGSNPSFSMVSPPEIPDDWNQLSTRGLLIISAKDLEAIAKAAPQKAEAIVAWLRTGTGLVVYGVGTDFLGLGTIEKSLRLPTLPKPKSFVPSSIHTYDRSQWNPLFYSVANHLNGEERTGLVTNNDYNRNNRGYSPPNVQSQTSAAVDSSTALKPLAFQAITRSVGLGLLVAVDQEKIFPGVADFPAVATIPPAADPMATDSSAGGGAAGTAGGNVTLPAMPGSVAMPGMPTLNGSTGLQSSAIGETPPAWIDAWQLIFDNLGQQRLIWENRVGMDLRQENHFYWNMLIPGVGASPVWSFLVLVTFFVIIIGPLNFSWVKRRKQPVLLLLTVPIAGAFATLLLFAYALISDGISTRARIHSFTHLDQKTSQATSWSRHTYYAAIAPSKGYTFNREDVVFPIVAEGLDRSNFGNAEALHVMRWVNDKQQLEKGYLHSRSFSQLLTIHSGKSTSQLLVASPKDSNVPEVTNRLAGNIELVYLCDGEGKFYKANDIAWEKSQKLTEALEGDIRREFVKLLAPSDLAMPLGFDPTGYSQGLFGSNYRRYYGNSTYNNYGGTSISTAAKEFLKNSTPPPTNTTRNSSFNEMQSSWGIQKREFVAIVNDPRDVPLGLENPRQLSSQHVITGNW